MTRRSANATVAYHLAWAAKFTQVGSLSFAATHLDCAAEAIGRWIRSSKSRCPLAVARACELYGVLSRMHEARGGKRVVRELVAEVAGHD